jgi:hypothetical protein
MRWSCVSTPHIHSFRPVQGRFGCCLLPSYPIMNAPYRPLRPYKDVDVDLVDDCPLDKFSDAPPDYNAPSPPQQEVDEDDAEFVKWWTRIRTQRIKREPVLAVIRDWSEDRRRNAKLVRKAMFAPAALMSILSIPVRSTTRARGGQVQALTAW